MFYGTQGCAGLSRPMSHTDLFFSCINFDLGIAYFSAGNDAFLEQRVNQLLQTLLSLYSSPSTLEKLEFDIHFPGISSFYDLYVSSIEYFLRLLTKSSLVDIFYCNFH